MFLIFKILKSEVGKNIFGVTVPWKCLEHFMFDTDFVFVLSYVIYSTLQVRICIIMSLSECYKQRNIR